MNIRVYLSIMKLPSKSNITEDVLKEIPETLIVKLFKYIKGYKKKGRTKKDVLEFIEKTLTLMGIPKEFALFVLEAYVLNYRKSGDYSDLTRENFIDPRYAKGKTTSNTKADNYTIAQMPFRGSNLEGSWKQDPNGVNYYEVTSYGWYPIYIYKDGNWYQNSKGYSSSTGRQMRNANPLSYNTTVQSEVYLLTPEELEHLKRGANHEQVMKKKLENLKKTESEIISKRLTTARSYYWGDTGAYNIKFKIKSIDYKDNKAIITIDVYDVLKRSGGKGIETPENYLKGELPDIDKDKVEKVITQSLREKLRDFRGVRGYYNGPLDEKSPLVLKFNHLKS